MAGGEPDYLIPDKVLEMLAHLKKNILKTNYFDLFAVTVSRLDPFYAVVLTRRPGHLGSLKQLVICGTS